MHKFSTTIGDGINSSFNINHNLGTCDIVVCFRQTTLPCEIIIFDTTIIDENNIEVSLGQAPSQSEYTVTIIG